MIPVRMTRLTGAISSALTAKTSHFVAVLTLILASLSCTYPAIAAPLRVLTYNIHHSEGLDAVFDLQRIADVITAASPDIVALQELDQGNGRSGFSVFQLDDLALSSLQEFG